MKETMTRKKSAKLVRLSGQWSALLREIRDSSLDREEYNRLLKCIANEALELVPLLRDSDLEAP